jgi:hypothetical protein
VRLIGRLSILAICVAIAAWAVWFVLLQRSNVQLEHFVREAKVRWERATPRPAAAQDFRATVCAPSPCVLVEAGGLSFLIGAGKGSVDGLSSLGLMRPNLDAVLLTDLELRSVVDLSELQRAGSARGRSDPTTVFGPEGVLAVVDGANLLLAGSGEGIGRLQAGPPGLDQGLEGVVVIDTGVVTVRAFNASGVANARLYRLDFAGKSLIVAGCSARPADVVRAARGAGQAAAVLAAKSDRMLGIEQKAAARAGATQPTAPICMSSDEALGAIQEARLAAGLLSPLLPAATDTAARRAWQEILAIPSGIGVAAGSPGDALDLSGETPLLQRPR